MFSNRNAIGSGDLLVRVDAQDKASIRRLEGEVKKKTGLNWLVTRMDENLVHWELLLPIRGGKCHFKAQSNLETPLDIYGFHVLDSEEFMLCLKQIAQKK